MSVLRLKGELARKNNANLRRKAEVFLLKRAHRRSGKMVGTAVVEVRKKLSRRLSENGTPSIHPQLHPFLDQILCIDCLKGFQSIPGNSIDLIVTSPPYDGIRDYKGYAVDLSHVGKECYRVLRNGGIAVMVVQDQTKNFAKTLTSFRTILDWCDNAGFRLFECCIYRKNGMDAAWWRYRFRMDHEYIPIFLKGERPRYFDKEPLKVPSKHAGRQMTGCANRRTDGVTGRSVQITVNPMKCRGTVWDYLNAGDKDPVKRQHPAPFPDQLAYDAIQCFCPKGGVVLDPFMGSGSTAVSAVKAARHFIGFEIAKEYCQLAEQRVKNTTPALF